MWEAENIGPYENQKLKPARTAWEKWQIELERLAKASEAEKIPDLYLSYESEFMGLPRYILALSMYTVAKSQNGQDDKSTAFEWYKRVIEMDTEESTISIKLLALHAVFAMRMELGETQKALKSANTIFVLAKESPIGTTAIGHITVTLATHGIWPLIWENTRNAKSVSGIIMGLVLWASRVLEHESKPNALSKFRGLLEDCTQNLGPNAETSLSAIIIGLAMVTESKSLIQDIVQEFRHILKNHEQTLPNIVERIVFEIAAGNEEFEIESVGDPDVEASIDAIWALLDFSEVPFKD